MGLRLKFNLVLLLVFLVGLGVAGWISREILIRNAREEVARNAGLMMETALAVRGYTISQVRPHLDMQLMRAFLPQSVPAFAASRDDERAPQEVPGLLLQGGDAQPHQPAQPGGRLGGGHRPGVPEPARGEGARGERDTPTGRALYIARPIQIGNPACLGCHSDARGRAAHDGQALRLRRTASAGSSTRSWAPRSCRCR